MQGTAHRAVDRCADLPCLPTQVVSMDGQLVDTSTACWCFRSSSDGGKVIPIPWARFDQPAILSDRARFLVKLFIADKISRKKARTVENDFRMFLRLQEWLGPARRSPFEWADLTEGLARAFLAHGVEHTADKGNDFSRLRTFYRWGVARQHRDFDPVIFRILQSITAVGNSKGHYVRFRDPVRGPFSPDELLLISRAVAEGRGTNKDRAIVMLHLELGHNPNASARLRNEDLVRYETKSAVAYQLEVPRVKKRTSQRETKSRPISTALGRLLECMQQGAPKDPLLHWLPSENPEGGINRSMRRFAKATNLVSPRTQRPLVINPRRFRFSIATHMAEEGASAFHIAEVLDHTDTQNVMVYVETVSSITDSVAKATDATLAPLVRRFQGKVVDPNEAAAFEGLPNQLIPAIAPDLDIFHLNAGGIGLCGREVRKDGPCRLLPPVSCYLCPSFAALRTGPHQQMLDSIQNFLHLNQDTSDRRILMQLEDVRLAIQQVLEQLSPPAGNQGEAP
jgi:integrase